jgi:CYTH domain-containing protein
MNLEIERKFLVTGNSWREGATGVAFRQGYIGKDRGVRVRLAGDKGFLTLKSKPLPDSPISRREYEYEIPAADAQEMLNTLCDGGIVEKTRFTVMHQGFLWEIDEFEGANQGLIVAEIELKNPEEQFPLPPWIGKEVSDDPRYANAALAKRPHKSWADQ